MSTEQKQDIHCGTCTVKGDMVACLATPCSVRSSWFANSQAAEIERLTGCLEKANIQAENFEREWYLRGDENEALKADAMKQEAKIKALVDALDVLIGYHDSFAPSDLAIAVKAFEAAKEAI